MRVEDLDPPRVKEGAEEDFLRDHAWLGLDWDEGPYHQSARSVLYERAIERLVALGHVYPCTCSRKEIEAIASAPHGEEGPIYPGTCRGGPSHPGRPAAMRFRMPEPPPAWTDPLAGPVPEGAGRGDFVVRRADGLFAYQLAVVVDDAAMGVTEVVRGSDLLASTPRQLALFAALAETPPTYVHLPLVRGPDGERLAKRHGAKGIGEYRALGFTAERLLGAVACSLGLLDRPEPVRASELVPGFSLERIRTSAEGDAALLALDA